MTPSSPPAEAEAQGCAEASATPGQGRVTGMAIALTTVLALGLRLYQLLRPGYLFGVAGYDDGVYFGGALKLVDGVLPYRDFADVQPPGITLLMAPVALLAKITGTGTAMAVARLLTAAAGAAGVALAGLLVRHRGVVAVTVAGGIMAVFPDGILASQALLLEPWLVLACLAGAVAVFDGDHLARDPSRLAWGGVLFGFAGAIKTWAILPVVAITVLIIASGDGGRQRARRTAAYLGGAAAGFLAPVLPFAALAPKSFYDGVVVAQLLSARIGPGIVPRLADMTGLSGIPHLASAAVVPLSLAIAGFIVLATTAAWLLTRRPPPVLDRFALLTAALVVWAFVWTTQFYDHYAAFAAPFLALCLVLSLSRLLAALPPSATGTAAGPGARGLQWCAAGVAVLALAAMAVTQARSEASAPPLWNPKAGADRVIPRGACVVSDTPSPAIAADRFPSSSPGCTAPVDSFGTLMALSQGKDMHGATAAQIAAVTRVWLAAFSRAQYVWLYGPTYGRIPWTGTLVSYFTSHFRPVHGRYPRTVRACVRPITSPCGIRGGIYVRTTPSAVQG